MPVNFRVGKSTRCVDHCGNKISSVRPTTTVNYRLCISTRMADRFPKKYTGRRSISPTRSMFTGRILNSRSNMMCMTCHTTGCRLYMWVLDWIFNLPRTWFISRSGLLNHVLFCSIGRDVTVRQRTSWTGDPDLQVISPPILTKSARFFLNWLWASR